MYFLMSKNSYEVLSLILFILIGIFWITHPGTLLRTTIRSARNIASSTELFTNTTVFFSFSQIFTSSPCNFSLVWTSNAEKAHPSIKYEFCLPNNELWQPSASCPLKVHGDNYPEREEVPPFSNIFVIEYNAPFWQYPLIPDQNLHFPAHSSREKVNIVGKQNPDLWWGCSLF